MATYVDYQDLKARKPSRWWHDSVIDYMLANPTARLSEIAHEFKRSYNYMSIILNTDMFKARLAARRNELNAGIHASIQNKLLRTLDATLDVVHEQITTKRTQIPFRDTSAFVNSTLERLGYGVKQGGGTAVQVNVSGPQVRVTAQDLEEARALLRRSEAARVVDALPQPAAVLSLPADEGSKELPSSEAADAA